MNAPEYKWAVNLKQVPEQSSKKQHKEIKDSYEKMQQQYDYARWMHIL